MPNGTTLQVFGFNPTLVRLRREEWLREHEEYAGFNPTLVRLRHEPAVVCLAPSGPFQSHAGSIEAGITSASIRSPNSSFNPTLVRLRLICLFPCTDKIHAVSIPRWFD